MGVVGGREVCGILHIQHYLEAPFVAQGTVHMRGIGA